MTGPEWIAAHGASAPPALVARVRDVLVAHSEWKALSAADALLNAGELLVRTVLGSGADESRAVALDLLAADACVTWAFEAAADEPASLPVRAEAAMQRIAKVMQ